MNLIEIKGFKRIYLVLVLLAGLTVNVFLILKSSQLTTLKAATSAQLYFTPDRAPLPPDAYFKLMLDPKGQSIAFVKVTLHFDPDVLRLLSNPVLGSSSLQAYTPLTTAEDANNSGIINAILVLRPGATAPSSTFEVLTLPVTFLNSAQPSTSYITIVDEQTQVVNISASRLPLNLRTAAAVVKSSEKAVADASSNPTSPAGSGRCSAGFVDTAIGCIPYTSDQAMAAFFLRWGLGIAGGIALILIVYSGYMVSTSFGDPRRLQAGKELLVAALSGLFLLVMGAYILRVIGVDILQLPGF